MKKISISTSREFIRACDEALLGLPKGPTEIDVNFPRPYGAGINLCFLDDHYIITDLLHLNNDGIYNVINSRDRTYHVHSGNGFESVCDQALGDIATDRVPAVIIHTDLSINRTNPIVIMTTYTLHNAEERGSLA